MNDSGWRYEFLGARAGAAESPVSLPPEGPWQLMTSSQAGHPPIFLVVEIGTDGNQTGRSYGASKDQTEAQAVRDALNRVAGGIPAL